LADGCSVLRQDESLPTWPKFSPDGELLAYVTEVGASKVVIVSTKDGALKASWDAHYKCPPVWSGGTTVWSLEIASGRYFWSEHDAISGTKTGNRRELPGSRGTQGEPQCSSLPTPSDSPFFERVRTERAEVSRVLSVELPPRLP
jgi:hypothetical protein